MGRIRPTISDESLLELIVSGILMVDIYSAEVRKGELKLIPTIVGGQKNGTRYRIEICHLGCKRSIVRSRLIYMAGARICIPPGYEIHHLDNNRYNDSFANLVMLTKQDHLKMHTNSQIDDTPF